VIEPIGYLIVGLFAIGMALSFLAADPHSPTSRPLCLLFGLLGVVFLMNIPASRALSETLHASWLRMFAAVEVGILTAGFEWILRVGRTEVPSARGKRGPEWLLRASQGLACLYGLAGIAMPELRGRVWVAPWAPGILQQPGFYVFAVPFGLSLALAGVRITQLVGAELDRAESLRLNALALATPFWCAGFFLPWLWKPVGFAIGETIFLFGAIRYHVAQGQRGQFLARFLSPQLVRVVRERGLSSTLQRTRVELSVVACDLRGFTAFSETAAPEDIMKLLEEYYAAVGDAVIRFGGSISNFAGDGIVALVGAPIAYADHAARAIDVALAIRDRTGEILSRWRALGLEVGVGVGVASGFVTVGVIGGTERLEYTAVGPAVNLAARLCARAEAGQVLADARVVGSLGEASDRHRGKELETTELKGFARPVTIFTIEPGDGTARAAASSTRSPAPGRG
jgi:adenylate cyclase